MTEFLISDQESRQFAIERLMGLDMSEGREWVMKLTKVRKGRTLAQNRLMHMWFDRVAAAISDVTGYDADEIKMYCAGRFGPMRTISIDGHTYKNVRTHTYKVDEMSKFLDRVHAWATDPDGLALKLPLPVEMHER